MAGPASARAHHLLAVAISVAFLLSPVHLTTPASDADALLRFKTTLSAPSPTPINWAAGSRPCDGNRSEWAGVICDNGTVLGLQLENMSLSGTLRLDALTPLPGLRTLSFLNNSLEGPMPDVKKLVALKSIYLSMNRLSGGIPSNAFSGMAKLKKVHLSQNRFSGSIPSSLSGLPKLLELKLDGNGFTGGIPELRQRELKMVNLSNNDLEGAIPDALSKMDVRLFQGNKNLCGKPLGVECRPMLGNGGKPPMAVAAGDVFLAVVAVISAIGMFLAVGRCRAGDEQQLGRPLSSKKHVSFREEHLGRPPSKSRSAKKLASFREDRPEPDADDYIGGAGRRKAATVAVRAHEQGRLVFVKALRGDWEKFELQDLLKASAEVMGGGTLGASYKAVLMNGPAVVVKRFREMNAVGREGFQEHMSRLGRLSHPNLLPLVAYYYRREEKLLLTDYIPGWSLASLLHGNNPSLDWPTRLRTVKGVARGLVYLYDALRMLSIPHGHLKSSNVLLDESFEPLLMDYALVPLLNQAHASQTMVAYRAPENRQFGRTSKKSDVWSFGVLVLEILTGRSPDNFHTQENESGMDLESWVSSAVNEERASEVFDSEMSGTKNAQGEMMKLLKIGLACCEAIVETRCEMSEAFAKIEELRERDSSDYYNSR